MDDSVTTLAGLTVVVEVWGCRVERACGLWGGGAVLVATLEMYLVERYTLAYGDT